MKKLWYYTIGQVKFEATLTNLRELLPEKANDKPVKLRVEKLDSNWQIDWTDDIPVEWVNENSSLGEWPYCTNIPKRIRTQIEKALAKK
tara:strand:- start:69 stop:335 length:267 start_codon:yes stop_codon:yes gene_type:complete